MKSFREYLPEQSLLLPPSLDEWLPKGHLARFVSDMVAELDLSGIYAAYEQDGRGQAAYHPLMMTRVLLYGYATGKLSSRKLERACQEEVSYRYLSGNQLPDHDTIATFRRRHLRELGKFFAQVVRVCQRAGMVKLGHVAIDGTKMKANASRSKSKSYEDLGKEEQQLREEVEQILAKAEAIDEAEDKEYGKGRRGDELPAELTDRQSRLKKIREAKASLEREAREQAERKKKEAEEAEAEREAKRAGRNVRGAKRKTCEPVDSQPKATVAGNTTDPDSRILKCTGGKGFLQGYNAQAAVDGEHQIIVAAEVVQDRHDRAQLNPMLDQVQANTNGLPTQCTADTGYYNPRQVRKAEARGVDLYVKPDKPPKHNPQVPDWQRKRTLARRMRQKLETEAGRAIYRKRRETVEPVFGQTKEARGIRGFLLRGLHQVRSEWTLICLGHNLRKLWKSGWTVARATA